MSNIPSLIAATEQRYNLPPGILRATAQVESHFNPRAISPQGAQGLMQLMPATASSLGVDPHDVPQAIDGAGRIWAQNLKASGGDIDRAAMMYHGGNDTRQWGPRTHAYPGKLAAALGPSGAPQPQQEGGDPIEAALSGQPTQSATISAPQAQADPSDPIESALAGSGQDRQAEIASAQAQASKQLASGDEKGAIATLAQHNLQMAPGELDAFHAGKRSAGFNHVDQLPTPQPQTDQGLGFYEGLTRPLDNAATWLQEGAAKIGLDKPINALGSALGLPSNEQAIAGHKAYVSGQEAQGHIPGKLGEFAGEVAGTIPVALATKNPWIAGGASGALTTDDPNSLNGVLRDAAFGAVGGKAAHAVTGAAAGVIAPKVSKAVQALHDLGVQMTPGQVVGGALRRVEDAATSIPLLGDLVKNAQRRSGVSLNTAVINDRVLGPIGKALPRDVTGRDAVDFADNAVSDAYNSILPKLSVRADRPFIENVGQILKGADELPPDRAAQVQKIVNGSFLGRFNRPGLDMSGQTFKEADTKLGQLGREYSSSPDPEQRKMGGIFRDVQSELRGVLARSNPGHAAELSSINQAFANLVRVEGAASSAGAKGGVFTAPQLAAAVKRFDTTARKKATATGKALLQDVSDPASEVLPQTLPDSGTPYRTLAAYLLGGGAALKAAPAAAPLTLYTKTGQKAFQKVVLAPRGAAAKALANGLSRLKTPAAIAGGQFASETANGR